jgi:hypothetical protein
MAARFGRDVVIATLQDAAVDPDWQIRTARAHGARVLRLDSGIRRSLRSRTSSQTCSACSAEQNEPLGADPEPASPRCGV